MPPGMRSTICPGTPLDGKVLLQALGLDQLNSQLDRQPDGLFELR
jgi:hypothetical protein